MLSSCCSLAGERPPRDRRYSTTEKAERTIVILISELEAYRFLRSWFTNSEDVRTSVFSTCVSPIINALCPSL